MDRPRRSRNVSRSSGVGFMVVDSSTDSLSTPSSRPRKRHSQRLESSQSKRQKKFLVQTASPEPDPEPSPVQRRQSSTASRPPKTPVSVLPTPRAKATSKAPTQDSIDEVQPLTPTQPLETSLRINIVHSFGHITTHEVHRSTKLTELFKLHYAEGGRKPCRGLAFQQTGRVELVNGSFYWKSGDGPTHRYFWDEGNRVRVQDTEWGFLSGEGWLSCTFSRRRWKEEREEDSGDENREEVVEVEAEVEDEDDEDEGGGEDENENEDGGEDEDEDEDTD